MQQDTLALFTEYENEGWAIHKMVTSEDHLCETPANSDKPLVVPIKRGLDLSVSQYRALLGFTPENRIVSIHSGMHGDGIDVEVVKAVTKQFRESGVVVCNGGYPGVPGLMRSAIEGALSAEGENLPPLVVVVTEDLFRKDSVRRRYPKGPIRVLVMEDSKHMPDTMLRAHVLNIFSDAVVAFPGAFGTIAESTHYMEGIGLRPDIYRSEVLMINLNQYYDGVKAFLKTMMEAKFLPTPLDGVGFYDPEKDVDPIQVANDVVGIIRNSINGNRFAGQVSRPALQAGTLQTLAMLAAPVNG